MEDSRGPRLFADLNHAFRKDPVIDEYDFLPVTEPQNNASPLLLVEHKLGLELWSVRLLFRYAYNRLMTWRDRNQPSSFIDPQELTNLTRAVLLIQPDCYTAWNIRKELIDNGDLSIADDIRLGQLILTKFPKSSETFIHRRWIFQRLVNQCLSSSNDSTASADGHHDNGGALLCMDGIDIALGPDANVGPNVNGGEAGRRAGGAKVNAALPLESSRLLAENLHRELSVCERAADSYASNYYAWTHRAWVVQHCFNCSLRVLLGELERTQTWTMKHVSDHSGFHYRQFLLTSLSQRASRLHRQYAKSLSSLIDAEHDFICDLINSFPSHEALWYHRKFVFHMMMSSSTQQPLAEDSAAVLNGDVLHGAVLKSDGQKRSRLEHHSPNVLKQEELDSVRKTVSQTKESFQKTLAKRYQECSSTPIFKITFTVDRRCTPPDSHYDPAARDIVRVLTAGSLATGVRVYLIRIQLLDLAVQSGVAWSSCHQHYTSLHPCFSDPASGSGSPVWGSLVILSPALHQSSSMFFRSSC
ncbi:hypothetical protein BaRGS_00011800 [Batillaria attramentaria]|uniref:Protein prenyltransferase alpha subunit repeat-containing protein 1 n=1 Tax=Batillaria attramentaria TaxID=370345 RepID=A0ABD0LBS6_9CAEN